MVRSPPRLLLDIGKAFEVVLQRVELDGGEAFGGELAGLFARNGLISWPTVQRGILG